MTGYYSIEFRIDVWSFFKKAIMNFFTTLVISTFFFIELQIPKNSRECLIILPFQSFSFLPSPPPVAWAPLLCEIRGWDHLFVFRDPESTGKERKIIEIYYISRWSGKGYSRRPRLLHDRSLGFPSHGNRTSFLFSTVWVVRRSLCVTDENSFDPWLTWSGRVHVRR